MEPESGPPLARIYLFQFVVDFIPVAALYAVMFAGLGLSTTEIAVLAAAWSATSLLLEVPSGVLADRHDRRLVLAAGSLLAGSTFLVWLQFPGFAGYLVGFVFWGAANAFHSGTFEALLYDELKTRGVEHRYVEVLGRAEFVSLMAVVISAAVAAPLVGGSYTAVLYLSTIACFTSAILAVTLPPASRQSASRQAVVVDETYFATLKRGLVQAKRAPGLARAIVAVAIAGASVDLVTEFAPLFVNDANYTAGVVALVLAALVLVMAGASAAAESLGSVFRRSSAPLALAGGTLFLATLTSGPLAIVLLGASAVVGQVVWILLRSDLQTLIDDDVRATSTSVAGFSQEVLNLVGLVAFGVLADATTRNSAFRGLALLMAIAGVVLSHRYRRSTTSGGNGDATLKPGPVA